MPLQKLAGLSDPLRVTRPRDLSNAGGAAVLNHVIEAVTVIPLPGNFRPAGSEAKLFPHQGQRLPQGPRMGKRPKVARLVLLLGPGQLELRKRLVQVHSHHQKPFVVPKTHVVARPVLFDQPPLQEDRLRLAPHHVGLQLRDALEKRPRLQVSHQAPRGVKILVHPPVQVPRLAHVNHPVEAVPEQIHPRPVRQIPQLLRQVGGNGFHGPKED